MYVFQILFTFTDNTGYQFQAQIHNICVENHLGGGDMSAFVSLSATIA